MMSAAHNDPAGFPVAALPSRGEAGVPAALTGLSEPARRDAPLPAPGDASALRRAYLRLLLMAFSLFNSIRLITYLPTIVAIHAHGDSSQYSLWTWTMWIGANLSMAAWLYETNGRKFDAVVGMNLGNAVMCSATSLAIVYYRL
jgi:hypothetical protein